MIDKFLLLIKVLNDNACLRCRWGNLELNAGGVVGIIAIIVILLWVMPAYAQHQLSPPPFMCSTSTGHRC